MNRNFCFKEKYNVSLLNKSIDFFQKLNLFKKCINIAYNLNACIHTCIYINIPFQIYIHNILNQIRYDFKKAQSALLLFKV